MKQVLYGLCEKLEANSMKQTRKVRIVLIETSHPGNIGATARAMKTMSQAELYLVNPKHYPSAECTSRAAGADDILQQAVVCESLTEALQGCSVIFATTARDRSLSWPCHDPRGCANTIIQKPIGEKIAIVFGRERSGLSNQEIEACNQVVMIPANQQYSSLNLAAAVQILCYEIMVAGQVVTEQPHIPRDEFERLITHDEKEGFFEHLIETMIQVGFYDPEQPKQLVRRVKRLFNRIQLEQTEVNILRGFLTAIQQKLS